MGSVNPQADVVMMNEASIGTPQVMMPDHHGMGGQTYEQLGDHNMGVMNQHRMKTEPEDLSLREDEEGEGVVSDLDADKRGMNKPDIIMPDDALGELVVQMTSPTQPPKRAKYSRNADYQVGPNKSGIAKQYSPFGFHCTLEAPTAQWVRKDEDRCTYMNKGQFYGVTMEYRSNPSEPPMGDMTNVKSVVMLVFRDAKNPDDEVNAWDFWQSRQPNNKQRIMDAETNTLADCGIAELQYVSHNAVAIIWNPMDNPAFLSIAIQCLSTDFSLQKGVKGLPMHLQVDTYVKNINDGEYEIVNRSYCQVKVFCDKGAERKCRQEERRAARKVNAGGARVLEMYHQSQERSEFYTMLDMSRVPVLYTPSDDVTETAAYLAPNATPTLALQQKPNGQQPAVQNNSVAEPPRKKMYPPPDTRMVVYVRQENEEIYTPLHLVPPTVPGLARAIETKYNVSATAIRYLYRRNTKGIVAKLDDDLLKFYCNEDTFLMQVTAIEMEGQAAGQDSIMYDITLVELNER